MSATTNGRVPITDGEALYDWLMADGDGQIGGPTHCPAHDPERRRSRTLYLGQNDDRVMEVERCEEGCEPAVILVGARMALAVKRAMRDPEPSGGGGALELIAANTVKPQKVHWLWRGWIPLGMLTLLAGIPGQGKTTLALELAADVTRGELEGSLAGEPATVLVASLEDSIESTLVPRLMAANAALDRVQFVACKAKGAALDLTRHLPEIDREAERHHARLLIVDPLVGTMPAGKISSWRDQDVRSVLAPLVAISEQRALSVLACMHFSKSAVDALLGVGGSIGFVGAARSLLIFGADPRDERGEEGHARVLAHRKCNVARRQRSRSCHILATTVDTDDGTLIETSRAILGDEVDVTADDLVKVGARAEAPLAQATKFLRQLLSDGPHRAREIYDLAEDDGISKRTLERAKRDLGIDSFRKDGAWWWILPEDDDEPEVDE